MRGARPLYRLAGVDDRGLPVYADEDGTLAGYCSCRLHLTCPWCGGVMRIIGRRAPKQSPLHGCHDCGRELVATQEAA